MTEAHDDTIAELQRANAELRRERDAALARRANEFSERIEHQAATVDVLKAMSASPGDPQPVFALIVDRAKKLCDSYGVALYQYDGTLVHLSAFSNYPAPTQDELAYVAMFPMPPTRSSIACRAILDGEIIHIRDMRADSSLSPAVRALDLGSNLAIPLIRDGKVIGTLNLNSKEAGGFSDSQVALLQTFAEQAVIAITSAETYRALQTRTSDLQESLEYQTATSDVLKVISRSTFDLQPVLDTLVQTAVHLCNADFGNIFRRESEGYRRASSFQLTTERQESIADRRDTHGVNWGSIVGRVVLEGGVVHVHDVASDPDYTVIDAIRLGKLRSSLGVPLMREGDPIGVITLGRHRVEPFTDRQIQLVSTFADQAVIAIENTRLITEQREALEQQTATAEVLQVINTSPGNLAPVFDAMLERAMRLCEASFGELYSYEDEVFHPLAFAGVPPAYAAYRQARGDRGTKPDPGSMSAQVMAGERVVHFVDLKDTDAYRSGSPNRRAMVDLGGARSAVFVALRKHGQLRGGVLIYRQEVRPFSDKQVALLENFAAQAVIAMENARLLTETREALEQRTATAEVLQVINASPGDLVPVFDSMLEKATRLCQAAFGILWTYDGQRFHAAGLYGVSPAFAEFLSAPVEPVPGGTFEQLLAGEAIAEVIDIAASEIYRTGTSRLRRAFVDLGGAQTVLFVALRKDDVLLGAFSIYREQVGPFSEKQTALVINFAAQAVIAMENARLLTEQQEALEQQTATAEVLQVINASPGNLTPVFDAILEKATRLCDARRGQLATFDGEYFRFVAVHGDAGFSEGQFTQGAVRPEIGVTWARIVAGEQIVHMVDVVDTDPYRAGHEGARRFVDVGGGRTLLTVALRKDDLLLGALTVYRQEVRAFTDKHIELLRSFAAQAVIAMENARLLTEQREALEQQTAMAEVLQVINASPGDLKPVFEAMLERAMRLCEAAFGELDTFDGERFKPAALLGIPAAYLRSRTSTPRTGMPGTIDSRFREGANVLHITDLMAEDIYRSGNIDRRSLVDLGGARTALAVALRKDDVLLGNIMIYRQEVRPFSDRQVALLQNFAAQAVVAMENARLITEQHEALEQQTATAEVLQVINANPGDLTPVFDAVLEKAMRLCGAAFGSLYTYDGERLHSAAHRGVPAALVEFRAKYPPSVQAGGSAAALLTAKHPIHIVDMKAETFYRTGDAINRATVDLGGALTTLTVPLLKDDTVRGGITIYRQEVRAFSDKQIKLLESFAAQAVIAMETARLLDEIRQRQQELHVTFENMGDGVAMFGADLRLAAWNRNFQQILDLPDELLAERPSSTDFVRYLATHGEYGVVDVEGEVQRVTAAVGTQWSTERTRPDGRVIELRNNPVPDGGFVLIYADITERKRSEEEIRAARDSAETALRELRTAQANLIQAEKMASLGQLTAGIAHEIKNPLNFVNNFSALSTELIDELRDVLAPEPLGETTRTEVDDLTALLKGNLEKVVQHGQRADGIVKAMLEHSRGSSGERRMVDLNALIDEALNLAYHGVRAQDQSFNITLEREFGEGIAPIEVNPQDLTRVFLNLFANGFYATTKRTRDGGDAGFVPTLRVTTSDTGDAVEVRVRDNGTGIPDDIRNKLFQPFFTTKPTGEGTGLGLSITYDIVTQQHGGSIAVDSKVGEYSEFTIRLPRNP